MQEFQYDNFICQSLAYLWYWIGRILGIIPVQFNPERRRFQIVKAHRFLASVCFVILTLGFPFANLQFFLSVNVVPDEVKYSFSMIAASLSNVFIYISAILAYNNQLRNAGRHLELMNKIAELSRILRDNKKAGKREKGFEFAISFSTSILMISSECFAFSFLVDPDKFNKIYFIFLMFPKVVSILVGNQYLLLIIHIKKFSLEIREKIEILKLDRIHRGFYKIRQLERMNLELENISRLHEKLFKISKTFNEIFTIQLLFLVGGCFLSVMTQCFYQSLFILFPYFDGFEQSLLLELSSLSSLLVQTISVTFHVISTANCMAEV